MRSVMILFEKLDPIALLKPYEREREREREREM
jgi:hypothetical protein